MAATAARENSILFVDDEQRVLTSMRAIFRHDYDVLLASSGAEALEILRGRPVDVVVSDQRMPGMTGVEVLKEVKELVPNAMRILLTGYADLKAIEASINDAEVFRYLMKPCPSDELKAAIALAAGAARGVVAQTGGAVVAGDDDELTLEFVDVAQPGGKVVDFIATIRGERKRVRPQAPEAPVGLDAAGVELLVLSTDMNMVEILGDAMHGHRRVHHARSIEQAIELLAAHPIGVLITDTAVSEKQIACLTAQLKQHVPELITIIASERSDAHALIDMINYGQIFRFLIKPLLIGQTRLWVQSAVNKHVELARNPQLVKRHLVRDSVEEKSGGQTDVLGSMISGVRDRVRRLRVRLFSFGATD